MAKKKCFWVKSHTRKSRKRGGKRITVKRHRVCR